MKGNIKPSAMGLVQEHWGADAPQWVKKLASACDDESQAAVARKIRKSASLVNMVLKNRYTGDLKGLESRVNAAFSKVTVQCPIIGSISGETCLQHQAKPYNPGNHIAVRLFKACRGCPYRISKEAK